MSKKIHITRRTKSKTSKPFAPAKSSFETPDDSIQNMLKSAEEFGFSIPESIPEGAEIEQTTDYIENPPNLMATPRPPGVGAAIHLRRRGKARVAPVSIYRMPTPKKAPSLVVEITEAHFAVDYHIEPPFYVGDPLPKKEAKWRRSHRRHDFQKLVTRLIEELDAVEDTHEWALDEGYAPLRIKEEGLEKARNLVELRGFRFEWLNRRRTDGYTVFTAIDPKVENMKPGNYEFLVIRNPGGVY